MAEESEKERVLREILVAVDTSPHSHAALEAAVTLAHILEANVKGLFVENELWGRLSDLPVTTSISELTGEEGPLERDTVEEKMTRLRNRIRDRMHDLGQHYQVTYSMETASGKVDEKVLEASRRSDLITLGLKGNYAKRGRLGSTARAIIRQSDKPVLILEKGMYVGTVLTVVYDGSPSGRKGLAIALQIAKNDNSRLSVLVTGEGDKLTEERRVEVRDVLDRHRVFADVQAMPHADLGSFMDVVYRQRCGLLVLPKGMEVVSKYLDSLLRNVKCPLLLVS
ncbi:MAG: universal stress protein [Balneolaceae bacterium]|nr:universal stress protein [Balneolaceae bacterium]